MILCVKVMEPFPGIGFTRVGGVHPWWDRSVGPRKGRG